MSTAHTQDRLWHRIKLVLAYHFQNAVSVLRRFSWWVLLVPAVAMCLIVLDHHTGFEWFEEKATQEIIAPSILAVAVCVSLLFWARAGGFYARWLVLLSASLFCRELHFWGTNNGIYLAIIFLLWYASRNFAVMKPLLESRAALNLFGCAMFTYTLTKTFDRGYWKFIAGWKDWQDTMEESLESVAHLMILGLAIVSYVAWGRLLRLGLTAQTPLRRRLQVWGMMCAAVVAGVLTFGHWFGEEAKLPRSTGGFPNELSSLCNVNPELGENLYLASSDEEHKLTLWTFNSNGKPTAVKQLELTVPVADGSSLHLDDLEDIAWDGGETYYAVTSHRHLLPSEEASRRKKSHGTECALVRFHLAQTDEGIVVTHAQMVTQDLLAKIRKLGAFPSIDWSTSKVFSWRGLVKTWQLDIEGLAAVDGKLLLGFKDPIEDGKATILSYDPATDELAVAARPNLGGHGILCLHYEPATDRLFVLSNDPIKHRFAESCLWIGVRGEGTEAWVFEHSPALIIERAADGKSRKASGVTVDVSRLIVCFDCETSSTIKTIELPELISAQSVEKVRR